MSVPSAAAVAALGARVLNGETLPAQLDVVTDTRTVAAGQTFLALRGERFDGHTFTAQAFASGAAALIVDDPGAVPGGLPALVVPDTLRAYLALGGLQRAEFSGTVIAVTGSAGKTTTKDFIAQLIEHAFPGRVAASVANENNEIGVAKLLLGLPSAARFAVVEMGARHYGDIAPLAAAARPHVGVLTNIGEAHLEIMGSRERLAETKWAIFHGGALPVVNFDDPFSIARTDTLERTPHFFAVRSQPPRIEYKFLRAIVARVDRTVAVFGSSTGPPVEIGEVPARIIGRHNLANAAAAVAALFAAGLDPEAIGAALPGLTLPAGRYERIEIASFAPIIYDAYNASPDGMIATLATFSLEAAQRRIAVLASMAELGAEAPRLHREVGIAAAKANLAYLLVGGEFADELAEAAGAEGFPSDRIVRFGSNAQAAQWLRGNTRSDDLILLKGARKYRLEEIVADLRADGPA